MALAAIHTHKINVDNKKFNLSGILSGEHHRKNVTKQGKHLENSKERHLWIEGRKLAEQLKRLATKHQ